MKIIVTKNKKTIISEPDRQYFKYWIKIIDDNGDEVREDEVAVPASHYLTPDESAFNIQGILRQTWPADPEICAVDNCEIEEVVIE